MFHFLSTHTFLHFRMNRQTKISHIYAAVVAFTLFLASCNRGETLTPTPTATQEPSTPSLNQDPLAVATLSSLSTATLLPSAVDAATATPTDIPLQPSELRQRGLRQLRYGDYAAARKDFQSVIDGAGEDTKLRLQAQFDLARAYRADGMYQQALESLSLFESQGLEENTLMTEMLPKVWLLQGELQRSMGEPSLTIQSMNKVLAIYPWAEELVQSEIGAAQRDLGNFNEASVAYRAAANLASTDTAKAGWLESSASSNSDGKSYAAVIADYDAILNFAKRPEYRADLQYRAGQILAAAGDEPKAIERWLSATRESPESQSAYFALVELVNRNVDFDLYQRGYIDLNSEAWYPAINAYQNFLQSVSITETRYALAVHQLGQSQLGAGEHDAALASFERVITQFPDCTCFGQAWMDKARTEIARGDSSGGRRTYRSFARLYPTDPLAAEALWQSGVRALRDDNRMEAAADFLTLADSFPTSNRAPSALYAVATGAFQGGFYTQAANIYQRLKSDYPGQLSAAVDYWLGRALDAHSETEQAKLPWQSLVEQAPDTYYGILAAAALQQKSPSDSTFLLEMKSIAGPSSTLEGDDGSQVYAEKWLTEWEAMRGDSLSVLSDTVAADTDLLQGKLMLEVDRRYEGLLFLNRVFERYKGNPRDLYPLSLEFERIEAYQLSISSMQLLLQQSPARLVEDAPIFLQKKLYPQPFAELIVKEAQAQKINPLLYFSLIRQESLFEEGARSGAAAQGLAQIIPDTAHWVATQLGHPDWSNELIYRPYINLQFGAYYLNWARNYLDGSLVSALVGYNAGPGNAEYWREISGPDDALFVEILAVNEPRIYVQIITSNLYHYTRLYQN